jgi:hypothetical protein
MATARQRRAARRRAIRNRFPVGTQLCSEQPGYAGDWIVYGHRGQSLKIRRRGMRSGYTVMLPCISPFRVFYIGG